jgi:cytochrome oxidase Cu insertion factor (SCO1/SenC/PrrC family)
MHATRGRGSEHIMPTHFDNVGAGPPGKGGGRTVLFVVSLLGGLAVICGGVFLVFLAMVAMGKKFSPSGGGVAVGQVAPEIEGQDLDGQPFKLSDYRGKVVLLDFWGNW